MVDTTAICVPCDEYLRAHQRQIQINYPDPELYSVPRDADDDDRRQERGWRWDEWYAFVDTDKHRHAYQRLRETVATYAECYAECQWQAWSASKCSDRSDEPEAIGRVPQVHVDSNWDWYVAHELGYPSLQRIACNYALNIWWDSADAGSLDQAVAIEARKMATAVQEHAEDVATRDWIACIPLERRFCRFPAFQDFGTFSIVNATAAQHPDGTDAIDEFMSILQHHVGMANGPLPEGADSYRAKAELFYKAYDSYIPGRPQLVLSLGRGELHCKRQLLREWMRDHVPLIRLCQLACDVWHGVGSDDVSQYAPMMPDGTPMASSGMFRIPDAALLLDRNTSRADLFSELLYREWDPPRSTHSMVIRLESIIASNSENAAGAEPRSRNERSGCMPRVARDPSFDRVHAPLGIGAPVALVAYEQAAGRPFCQSEFREAWETIGAPLVQLRKRLNERTPPNKPDKARVWLEGRISNAIALVVSSMYGVGGNLALNAVIATEAILKDPFERKPKNDISEKFKVRASRLAQDFTNMDQARRIVEALYEYRCDIVHRAGLTEETSRDIGSPVARVANAPRHPERGIVNELETEHRRDVCARNAVLIFLDCLVALAGWALGEGDSLPREERKFSDALEKFYSAQ